LVDGNSHRVYYRGIYRPFQTLEGFLVDGNLATLREKSFNARFNP